MYNSKTIRAAMLTNTTTFSFFFCGSFRLALSRYRQSCWCCCYALWWTYICMRLRIRDYSCQQLLSLCVILALSLSLGLLAQWYRVLFGGIWLPIVVWGVTYIFDCMNVCTFVFVKEILLISVSSRERKAWREREREREVESTYRWQTAVLVF